MVVIFLNFNSLGNRSEYCRRFSIFSAADERSHYLFPSLGFYYFTHLNFEDIYRKYRQIETFEEYAELQHFKPNGRIQEENNICLCEF